MTTRVDEAQAILTGGHFINDFQHQVGVVAWGIAEGSRADNNMLDTEEGGEPGETNFNSVGVKNYPTLAEGVDAMVRTLHDGYYPQIVAWLLDPNGTAMQLASNPELRTWGTGTFVAIVNEVLADPITYFGQSVNASSFAPPVAPSPVVVTNYPEDAMQSVLASVSIKGGKGWLTPPSSIKVGNVVNVVPIEADPATIGSYPNVPQFTGATSDNQLVFGGDAPDGDYPVVIWVAA